MQTRFVNGVLPAAIAPLFSAKGKQMRFDPDFCTEMVPADFKPVRTFKDNTVAWTMVQEMVHTSAVFLELTGMLTPGYSVVVKADVKEHILLLKEGDLVIFLNHSTLDVWSFGVCHTIDLMDNQLVLQMGEDGLVYFLS